MPRRGRKWTRALGEIERDMTLQAEAFEREGKLLEAQRIVQRTRFDLEMMQEIGFCSGIENYSRYFDGRKRGDPPFNAARLFPEGFPADGGRVPCVDPAGAGDVCRGPVEENCACGIRIPAAFGQYAQQAADVRGI